VCISRSNSAAVCGQHCWWLRILPQLVGRHQCAGKPKLLAALARLNAKVRDQESKATRHTGARPDRDTATMRYFLHWSPRTLSWPRPHAVLLPLSTSQLEMFAELSLSTQSGPEIAGAVSSRSACCPTAAALPLSETEADNAAFPSLVASYCHPRPIFQVRASEELAWRSTRQRVVRGAASGRDNKAFSMPAGEGSEADR
jgi:hypothetical protein